MRPLAWAPIGAALLAPLVAWARDPPPSVTIEINACGEDIAQAVRERFAVELEVLWRESSAAAQLPSPRVVIRCDGELARIEVATTSETARSAVDLGGLSDEAKSRLVALKATELIHLVGEKAGAKSSDGDAAAATNAPGEDAAKAANGGPSAASSSAVSPQTPQPADRASADAGATSPSADRPPSGRPETSRPGAGYPFSAGAIALFAGRPLAHVLGPSLGAAFRLTPRWAIGADIDGTFGSVEAPDRALALRGGAAAATLLFLGGAGSIGWGIGVGGRAGLLEMVGEPGRDAPLSGRAASGVWAGPMIAGKVSYAFASSRWLVELGAEGGVVAAPLAALIDQSQRFYVLEGPWLGVRASLGFDLASR
jgi:hypothetical protein